MPHGDIDFFLPHSGNQFFFCLHGNILFGLAAMLHGDQRHVCLYDCHNSSACLPCLGSLILNGRSVAMNVPHGNILFSHAAAPHGNILFGLSAEPHGDIPSALRPCPLTAVFLWPCGRAPSRQYPFGLAAMPPRGGNQFSLCLTAILNFILPTQQSAPHGDNQFSLCLHGNSPLMAVINFLFASGQ
jgi:hypothetical protein